MAVRRRKALAAPEMQGKSTRAKAQAVGAGKSTVQRDTSVSGVPDGTPEIRTEDTTSPPPAPTKVIGLAINHENMTDAEVSTAITRYEDELGIPATDALTRPEGRLVDMVLAAFPELEEKLNASAR